MKDTVFQEILKPISTDLLNECVNIFNTDYDYEKFKTAEHLQTMIYVHLNRMTSLRTLEIAINAQTLGLSTIVRRSTLSDANRKRSSDCFLWLLEQLLCFLPKKHKADFSKVVKAIDSSPIQLKGYGYEWAKQSATRRCEGLKLHAEYDLGLKCPTRVKFSYPNLNDSSVGKVWPIERDTVYVFDKGYCDYNWWWSIHQKGAYFVTRLKVNAGVRFEKSFKVTSGSCILEDGLFKFSNTRPRGGKKNLYTGFIRRVSIKREGKAPLILVTNLVDESAEAIANLYKARWEVELFFKWIKQRLKIKKFLGRTENAVKIQLITAIIAYLLVFLFREKYAIVQKPYLVLIWIAIHLDKPGHCITKSYHMNNDPPNTPKPCDREGLL